MHGIGIPSVRKLVASYGPIGLVCAPFIRVTDHLPLRHQITSEVSLGEAPRLSVQLLGVHAGHLAQAAAYLSEAGVGVVDLNLGCPSRQVVRKGAGAGLLNHPERVEELVCRVRERVRGCLSVKMRAGAERLDGCIELSQRLEKAGANFLTIHGRSRTQGYEGTADWEWVRRVKAKVGIGVVGNGDCWYAADALGLMEWSGCDAVMLCRPALRNPWIFRQISEIRRGLCPYAPTGADVLGHLERLGTLCEQNLGHRQHGPVGALKEHVGYLLSAFPESIRSELGPRLLRSSNVTELLAQAAPLANVADPDLAANGPHRFERVPLRSQHSHPAPPAPLIGPALAGGDY